MHTHIHACMHTYTYMHAYIHTHMHAYIHTYTHIHTPWWWIRWVFSLVTWFITHPSLGISPLKSRPSISTSLQLLLHHLHHQRRWLSTLIRRFHPCYHGDGVLERFRGRDWRGRYVIVCVQEREMMNLRERVWNIWKLCPWNKKTTLGSSLDADIRVNNVIASTLYLCTRNGPTSCGHGVIRELPKYEIIFSI